MIISAVSPGQSVKYQKFQKHASPPAGYTERAVSGSDDVFTFAARFYPSFKGADDSESYRQELSRGLARYLEADIPPENLAPAASPGEIKKILPQLQTSNFVSSPENVHRSIYSADLDNITTFSYDGEEDPIDVLDDAVQYANFYNWRTGKKFTFAITDNDTVEGLWHVLYHIGSNPGKYKNMNFIPGIRLSFAHRAPNSNLGFENGRMLVLGINPASKGIAEYIQDILERRRKMVYDFINHASNLYKEFGYKIDEFSPQHRLVFTKDLGQSDLYWRIREYIVSKGDSAIAGPKLTDQEVYQLAEDIINGMDTVLTGSAETTSSKLFSHIIDDDTEVNILIKEIFDRYSTHYSEVLGAAESSAENIYNQMINCFAAEPQKPVMSIAAPFYFSYHFERSPHEGYPNTARFFNFLKQKSEGMLIGCETAAPMYDSDRELTPEIIKGFNDYIKRHTGFLETGGSFASRTENQFS